MRAWIVNRSSWGGCVSAHWGSCKLRLQLLYRYRDADGAMHLLWIWALTTELFPWLAFGTHFKLLSLARKSNAVHGMPPPAPHHCPCNSATQTSVSAPGSYNASLFVLFVVGRIFFVASCLKIAPSVLQSSAKVSLRKWTFLWSPSLIPFLSCVSTKLQSHSYHSPPCCFLNVAIPQTHCEHPENCNPVLFVISERAQNCWMDAVWFSILTSSCSLSFTPGPKISCQNRWLKGTGLKYAKK